MEVTYWTNDDGSPRYLLKKEGAHVYGYVDGQWVNRDFALRSIYNGDGVDMVPEPDVGKIMSILDKRDATLKVEKAQADRAGPDAIEDDRIAVESEVTEAVNGAFAKARERLGRVLGL